MVIINFTFALASWLPDAHSDAIHPGGAWRGTSKRSDADDLVPRGQGEAWTRQGGLVPSEFT